MALLLLLQSRAWVKTGAEDEGWVAMLTLHFKGSWVFCAFQGLMDTSSFLRLSLSFFCIPKFLLQANVLGGRVQDRERWVRWV